MGARLRAERKAQKMTLQALSRASGIAVSTLSKAELGQSYESSPPWRARCAST